jgi:WD40 repeat protein
MQEFKEIPLFVPGRKDVSVSSMEFSTDGQQLLASGYGEAFLFDVAAGKHLFTLTEKARFKNQYGAGSGSSILGIIESTAKEFIGRYTDRFKNKPELRATFSKDDKQIITVAQDMLIRFWNPETGTILRTLDPQLPEERNLWGYIDNSIVLSQDGAYALTYNRDGFDSGTLWDLEKGIKVRCYTFLGASRVEAAISENGDRVYAMINNDLYFLAGAPEKKEP